MRIATIDIGTNTVLLLIAERTANGLAPCEEVATITRLGRDVDRTRALHPESLAQTLSCLKRYDDLIRANSVDRVAVVGTSAMRDASGGESIRELVRSQWGVELSVLSGEEEARTTFAGSLSGLPLPKTRRTVAVIDVGGGSTEIILGRWGGDPHDTKNLIANVRSGDATVAPLEILATKSFDVGSVRLTERFIKTDPPTAAELTAVRDHVDTLFQTYPTHIPAPARVHAYKPGTSEISVDDVVAVAGTATTYFALSIGMTTYESGRVHGAKMSLRDLETLLSKLERLTQAERVVLPGLEPKRADVIVAGGHCLLGAVRLLRAENIFVSDRGVRWGLAESLSL